MLLDWSHSFNSGVATVKLNVIGSFLVSSPVANSNVSNSPGRRRDMARRQPCFDHARLDPREA
jgi:hypothetical protein